YLSDFFAITVLYDNPNIAPETEYRKRAAEQKRLVEALPVKHPVTFLEPGYDPRPFHRMALGLEQEPEGGARCRACYRMRMETCAREAKRRGFDFFCTTLTISPLKDAQFINRIGCELEAEYGIAYLYSDFKKRGGYQRSLELSREYGLYRQDYCGCAYSKQERERQKRRETR
ncbi:MAG: epoxyqueuosine reductase QueH, partial [Clostridiales bacterium]|nr:epoxyqueuosine reductase QueH [Clostridiales bacterium]